MTVFTIGVFHLQLLVQLKVQDDKVLAKELAVAVGAIVRRAIHEGLKLAWDHFNDVKGRASCLLPTVKTPYWKNEAILYLEQWIASLPKDLTNTWRELDNQQAWKARIKYVHFAELAMPGFMLLTDNLFRKLHKEADEKLQNILASPVFREYFQVFFFSWR